MLRQVLVAVTIAAAWPSGGSADDPATKDLLDSYSLQQWTVDDGLPERAIRAIAQAPDGYLWVATSRHLLRFDGFRFTAIGSPGDEFEGDPDAVIEGISASDETGGMEVVTTKGVFRTASGGWEASRLRSPGDSATDHRRLIDRDGGDWWGDEQGIRRTVEGGLWVLENGKSPVNVSTNCLAEDDEGNLWVGTDAGLLRLRRRTQGAHVRKVTPQAVGVRAAWIAQDGGIWVTAEHGGVFRFPAEPSGSQAEPVLFSGEAGNLRFESILVAESGEVWLGTDGAAVWHGFPGGALEPIPHSVSGCRLAVVPALAVDSRRRIWIGSGDGLFVFDPAADRPRAVAIARNNSRAVESILCDDDDTLWVARQDDFLLHVAADGSSLPIEPPASWARGAIWAVHRDRFGDLWAGGEGRLLRLSDTPPTEFDAVHGLPDSAIMQIEDTASGVLWLGTRDGLFACDLRRLQRENAAAQPYLFRRFDPDGPLAHAKCTGRINKPRPSAEPLDGGACFPTSLGLVELDAEAILTRPAPPTTLVESVTVTRRDGSSVVSPAPNLVRVPADATSVTIRYTAIHLSAPEAIRFRYRLVPAGVPIDAASSLEDWAKIGRDRRVLLSGLAAGRQRWEVKAGIDGRYAPEPTVVVLEVEPLLWERPAFIALAGAAAAAVVAAVSSVVLRRRYRRTLARERTLQQERERIARDIHDDLGAGLTHVAHLSAMAIDGTADRPAAETFQRIFRATTGLAQSLDEIVWAVNPANDSLDKLVSYLAEFAQEFAAAAGVACRLDLPDEVPERPVPSPVRHHLCMLLKETMHNAVTHGQPEEILLALRVRGRFLSLTIHDDGRGFDPDRVTADESGRRSGIVAMHQRIAELGGRLAVDSTFGKGATVRIEVEV